MEFTYYMPVRVIFGKGAVRKSAAEFKRLGSRALIVTGKNSSDINGSMADTARALEECGIPYEKYGGIKPNPNVEDVRDAATAARSIGADFIIGVGGGSPLDAAKAVAILAANDIDDETLFSGIYRSRPLPVAAIPTTAGTGSEVTPYSILTYRSIRNKKSIGSPLIFPVIALIDPAYTYTLGINSTINTAIDALSHAAESCLAVRSTPAVKPAAHESMRLIAGTFSTLRRHELPSSSERESLMYASMLAGTCIAQTGTTVVHSIGYPLTYYRNVDHGRANGLVMHGFLKFIENRNPGVHELLEVMGMGSTDEFGAVMNDLLGEREKLSEDEIKLFTDTVLKSKNIANTMPQPSRQDIEDIIRFSFPG
jgi:alcohol dehydrogenase class IV